MQPHSAVGWMPDGLKEVLWLDAILFLMGSPYWLTLIGVW